jgi:hypothetical protein
MSHDVLDIILSAIVSVVGGFVTLGVWAVKRHLAAKSNAETALRARVDELEKQEIRRRAIEEIRENRR